MKQARTVLLDSLPIDMQVILCSFFGDEGLTAPDALKVRRIPLTCFPNVELADGITDERGEPHAREIMVSTEPLPPIVVNADAWWDGRHRVWAAKQSGRRSIEAIDLAGLLPKHLGIARLRPERTLASSEQATLAQEALESLFGKRTAVDGSLVADNFARWFDGSKLVDCTGAPLVVFHGTGLDKTRFTRSGGGAGVGAYFTPRSKTADDYAQMDSECEGDPPHVMPVYLSIKNPKWLFAGESFSIEPHQRNAWEAEGFDGVIGAPFVGADPYEFVAFRPQQIKSAVGNSGLFDPQSEDITDNHGWEAPAAQFERMRA